MAPSTPMEACTPHSCNRQAGLTLMEMAMVLAVSGILLAGGAYALSHYGADAHVDREAGRLVDALWELRAKATTGVKNPCLDFPDGKTVRLYSDASDAPDGFGPDDRVLRSYGFAGGVAIASIRGGTGSTHFVCYRGNGLLEAAGALQLTLGAPAGNTKSIRLLPATGMARVL